MRHHVKTDSATPSSPLQINGPYVAFCVLAAAVGLGFVCWGVTTQPILSPDGRYLSPGKHRLFAAVVIGFCLVTFSALLWKLYCDWKTTISEDSVTRPTPFGVRVIRWAEVTKAEVYGGVGIHIHAPDGKIVISPYAYRDPDLVFEQVRERLVARKAR